MYEACNSHVAEYNGLVSEYNLLLEKYQALAEEYNPALGLHTLGPSRLYDRERALPRTT